MTQPHYIDREAQPVSNPYKFEAEIAWLKEAARYFSNRPTGGEDAAHWANVYNAENANKIASHLDALSHTPAPTGAWWETVAATCHKLLCDELGLHPDEAAESAGVFADAILALSRPMEAVAWRLRRVGSEQWNFWDTPPWLALPVYADATKWEVQALAVIPTEGGGT